MKKRMLRVGLCALAVSGWADDVEDVFRHPPQEAMPGVWWHWMGCNVTREGITRDLEAFHAAGIGKATLFGMADVCTPWAAHIENSPTEGLVAFTDSWWKLVRHAAEEGKRLGVDVGMHNCPGYTHSGGPWIPPELSMQELCLSQTPVPGGTPFAGVLPQPQVDPRANMHFPVVNKDTRQLEKPIVEARRTYYRDIAVLALPAEGLVAKERVIDLTARMSADGRLEWTPPAGAWVLYRIGHTTMGSLTQPNQWEARGLECDKMSVEANEFHLQRVLGDLRKNLGNLVGTGLRHVLFDSYEAGTPSWTPRMPEEFATRRGYSLTPFLATFAKRTVGSEEETKKFKADFERTIADLYRDVHFATASRRLREAGLEFACEPYGGPFNTGEVAPYVHRVMTEFWTGGEFRGRVNQGLFNAGEGRRHNILEAEAFTGAPEHSMWSEYPDGLKTVGDGAFCAGINRLILHGAIHQPWDERYRPGSSMGRWGTHFGRLQTWWEPGKAWIAYLSRCQALLQWGRAAESDGFALEDSTGGVDVRGGHRVDGDRHVFFVANAKREGGAARLVFDVEGLKPELWDPVSGAIRDLPRFENEDGRTAMTLAFAAGQSWFVVFRQKGSGVRGQGSGRNVAGFIPLQDITGAWEVRFDPKWGGPEKPVVFDTLTDWTQRPEPGIKYYSGTAVYRRTFDVLPELRTLNAEPSYLSLGLVRHLARVTLNGRDLGVAWCAPWGVDVPAGVLKAKGNELEIEVCNVWANRLIGDEQEPDDCEWLPGHMPGGKYLKRFPDWFVKGEPRPSKGRYGFVTWNYFNKDSRLIPSGLLGPVRVMAHDWSSPAADPFASASNAARPRISRISAAAFESEMPKQGCLRVVSAVEEGEVHRGGGGVEPMALFNGTTKNGEGGAETRDDGKTFRGYGEGSSLTIRLDTAACAGGYDLTEIRTFAGHADARAGQGYAVLVATAAEPDRFAELTKAEAACAGGASLLRLPVDAKGVVAVRFVFKDGPLGFNVYREIAILGQPAGAKR